jgi:6-pyruvoyltetrahydropterin/6-carboxytetrahydropterin synthase
MLEVTVAGEPSTETGYVIDLAKLKQIIDQKILRKCDHKNLNLDVDFLKGIIPSTENLAKAFFKELEGPVSEAGSENCFLYSVLLQETERNSARYCPYLMDRKITI